MDDFADMYANRAPEAVRLYKEHQETVLLCVEDPPPQVQPGMRIVGKTRDQLFSELDMDSHCVKYLIHQTNTYNPEKEGIFVVQFARNVVNSVVVRAVDESSESDESSEDDSEDGMKS